MREIEHHIEVDKIVKEEVVLTKERISSYTVDKDRQEIKVKVTQYSDENSYVKEENHYFYSSEYIENPTENDLWELIDKKGVV